MPTYDYRCNACGHAFELFQQMTAPVKRTCPACGKRKLERLIGIGAGVLFKGGGFYETDYRSESYRKAAEAESKSADPSSEKKATPEPCGPGCGCAADGSTSSNGSAKKTKSSQGKSGAKRK